MTFSHIYFKVARCGRGTTWMLCLRPHADVLERLASVGNSRPRRDRPTRSVLERWVIVTIARVDHVVDATILKKLDIIIVCSW